MRRLAPSLLSRIRRDSTGVTAVEFGMLLLPLTVMLLGGLDLAHQVYVRGVAQGALDDVSRRATVENPQLLAEGNSLEEQIRAEIEDQINTVAPNARYTISQQSYSDFAGVRQPEPITTDNNGDGQYDAGDHDCFEDRNRNGSFDLDSGAEGNGGSNDVIFYTVRVRMERLFPIAEFVNLSPELDFTVSTAVRNQPYGMQVEPPVLCGV